MLNKLTIKNIALIDFAEINFTQSLNVLSGETGAGKSVIIESLNFVLGAKSDKTMIRSGQNECVVTAEFDVSDNDEIYKIYSDLDYEQEDVLVISRKFTIDGKSSIKINGNSATVSMLKRFTSLLVDVHGQSEHFSLLKTSNQLDLLDKFAGQSVSELKEKLKYEFVVYKDILKELDELGGEESTRLLRLDVLNYQINEIDKSNLSPDEEDKLIQLKDKLAHQEKIVTALNAVKSAIDDEGGISDILGNANRQFSSITDFDSEYSTIYDRLENAFSELNDISDSLNNAMENMDLDEQNPYEIEDRLDLIKSLKNKYGSTYDEIMLFYDNAVKEKEKLENFNELAEKLLIDKDKSETKIFDLYVKLSSLRRKSAKIFEKNILTELSELGMDKAQFNISFSEMTDKENTKFDSSSGFDKVEFLFSANSGEPAKPLSTVISGGEMSRFMLSIKAQTAKYNDISTFIFDEIDAGISGVVAKVVAEKFYKISKNVQVIAITHLPQISAMADNNLLIYKTTEKDKTTTNVVTLSKQDKIKEIVRLIGGDMDNESAVNHGLNLIEKAEIYKKSI